jgi:1,2-diacylglycerol 3-alpha-glucosyltransferase
VDGIYYDLKETLGSNDKLNASIFQSIAEASGIVFISDFSRQLVFRFYGELKKPYTVIHNAVDTRLFSPLGPDFRDELGIRRDETVLVTAAHWRKWKRLKDIVDLFLHTSHERPESMNLIVLGAEPDHRMEHEKIHYVGEIRPSKLASWYRTGDVYIHLAWLEACGNTQVEAMACGLPVLCTNLGGIGETVRKAGGGIVSETDEPFDLDLVNLYDPPRPDHDVLARDLNTLLDDLENYKKKIRFNELGIEQAAIQYCDFLNRVFRGGLTTTL